MIRTEESLATRLRVEPRRVRQVVDIASPGAGGRYSKLVPRPDDPPGSGVLGLLLREHTELELPMSLDLMALFEGWLRAAYRKEQVAALGIKGEETDSLYMLGFPVVHFGARGELDTLLRFPVARLEWRDVAGRPWTPPTYSERKRGKLPEPPEGVLIVTEPLVAGELPYSMNEVVLGRTLGVLEEDQAAFVAAAAKAGVAAPLAFMEAVRVLVAEGADAAAAAITERRTAGLGATALERLVRTLDEARILSDARAWPVGLLYDGSRSAATRHLQGELNDLRGDPRALRRDTALHCYLTGARPTVERVVCKPLVGPRDLTPEQRQAVEQARGSSLVAVQGPPGTGKTGVALASIAAALVDRMTSLASLGAGAFPSTPVLVVASTNNRAVDNAVDPLGQDLPPERLPIALRVGSQQVTATATVTTLRRAAAWLARDPEPGAEGFEEARRRFNEDLRAVDEELTPLVNARTLSDALVAASRRRARAEAAVADLEERVAGAGPCEIDAAELERLERTRRTVLSGIARARSAAEALLTRVSLGASPQELRAAWSRLRRKRLSPIRRALEELELSVELPVTPVEALGRDAEAWEEATDQVIDALDACERRVREVADDRLERARLGEALAEKQAELARLVEEEEAAEARAAGTLPDEDAIYARTVELRARLFESAWRLREVWARRNRDTLAPLCERVAVHATERRSLRRLFEDDETSARQLLALFPALGCTLLSLANAMPARPNLIDQLVVDEAGQCHPAYVVSGLLRARRALIIGDVHQLEPVLSLDDESEQRVIRRAACNLPSEVLDPYRVTRDVATSAQSVANRACGDVVSLREHFRCQEPIIRISDRLCGYDLRVRTPPRSYAHVAPLLSRPLVVLPVRGAQEPYLGSYRNDAEVERVAAVLLDLLAHGVPAEEVAVITPYRGQLLALRRRLSTIAPIHTAWDELSGESDAAERGVSLGTVHRFQGGERDVVLFSTVVTQRRSLRFLNERVNLVNVAVSRARVHLVVVGDLATLAEGRVTRELISGG